MGITEGQNILDIVKCCHCEIGNPSQARPRPEIQVDSTEKEIISSEIKHLLELGVIKPAVHSPDEYISTIFVRKKKSGKYRMILNLKGLNKHITKHHFKMDTLWSAVRLMTSHCFMASIDQKMPTIKFPLLRNIASISGFIGRGSSINTHACQMGF